jgi:hypothetical protein
VDRTEECRDAIAKDKALMPRKLKTYITNLGFFELALAAPSMKAALEAWGMGHNAFHQGFAKETQDAKIVAATMAKPGVVLRRPVGAKGKFEENAEIPQDLWKLMPSKADPHRLKSKIKPPAKPPVKPKSAKDDIADRAAILSFQKAKERRDREREKSDAKENVQRRKERAQIKRVLAKADKALDQALKRHEEISAVIAREREKLERRTATENARWDAERAKLKEARERAKGT